MAATPFVVPFASGVPYAPGPPDWWVLDVPGHDTEFDELRKMRDDPRWRGAAKVSIPGTGAGTGDLASIRALRSNEGGQEYLYLAFSVNQAMEPDAVNDQVWLCFHAPGGKGYRLKMSTGADTGVFEPHAVTNLEHWESTAPAATGGFFWNATSSTAPIPWITQTARAWVRSGEWAIHLRVPLTAAGAGLNAGVETGSRVAFLLQDWVSSVPTTGVVPYPFPAPDQATIGIPNSNDWAEIKPPGDPAAQGVALELLHGSTWHVGTANTPSSKINPGVSNTFFAMPTNKTANTIGTPLPNAPVNTRLTATFRIANWGSAINPGSTTIPGITGAWKQIIPAAGADPPSNTTPIPVTPAGSGPTQQITGSWTAPPFPAGTPSGTINHQCMLVELAGPFTFLKDSVVRNMDIVQASEFEREAEINVEGLGALDGPRRRVYLYVDVTNMPERVPDRPEPEGGRGLLLLRFPAAAKHDGEDDDRFPPEEPPTVDEIAAGQPTYRVYGFHETGERWRWDDGRDAAILAPQTSFGYLVEHSGPLYGWEHELSGSGLKKLADNLYMVRVPNEGAVKVRTRITAHERKPPWWRRGCQPLLAIFAAIGALGALVWRKLRK